MIEKEPQDDIYFKRDGIRQNRRVKLRMEPWAVVVAQLVERSLSIPEVRGSNPVIGKNLN